MPLASAGAAYEQYKEAEATTRRHADWPDDPDTVAEAAEKALAFVKRFV